MRHEPTPEQEPQEEPEIDIARCLKDLRNVNWYVRAQAVEALGRTGDPSHLTSLLARLSDSDSGVRYRAAAALGKIGDARAVNPLCRSLGDDNLYVRHHATVALGQIGEAAVLSLCEVLKTQNPPASSCAMEALAMIGAPAVLPLCTLLTKHNPGVRRHAIDTLERIHDLRAVPPLCVASCDSDWGVQSRASQALVRLNDIPAILPLCEVLKSGDRRVRNIASQLLDKMGGRYTLPRKVLADSRLSSSEKYETLEALREARLTSHQYTLGPVKAYCEELCTQSDLNPALKSGAEEVLAEIQKRENSAMLLRPGEKHQEGLLRPAEAVTTPENELLQASDVPAGSELEGNPGLLARFKRRRGA